MENFRVNHATGHVYEFDAQQNAFIFIGKLNGRTEEEFFYELFNEDDED